MGILAEVCCASVSEAVAAQEAGAGRIELCSALPVGGVTPSPGLFEEVAERVSIPLAVFVRPTEGGFNPSEPEFRALLRDVRWFLKNGADSVVAGTTGQDGMPDDRNREIVDAAEGRAAYHRALDTAPDTRLALETLVDLGFCRVLTAGGPGKAIDNTANLTHLVHRAEGRIELVVGGGVRADHVGRLVSLTHCRQVHLASRTVGKGEYAGFASPVPSKAARELIDALKAAGY